MLLAEHDPEVAELARRYLAREGLRVRVTAGPDETMGALGGRCAAVAVLDLTMPGLDPRRVRRPRMPAVFLLGQNMRPADLRVSADRCLSRPFSPRMLVARVRSLCPPATGGAVIGGAVIGGAVTGGANGGAGQPAAGLVLDPAGRRVLAAGRETRLTRTEFTLLSVLAGHAGRVLTRRRLAAALAREPSDRAVDVYVGQLRAKLAGAVVIRTVRGVGYVLDDPNAGVPAQRGSIPR